MRGLLLPLLALAACNGAGSAASTGGAGLDASGAAAPSVPLSRAPFRVEEMGRFADPWALAFLPDGAALVTDKGGRLKLWRQGAEPSDVAGVPRVAPGGQGGLLDVVLSPRFARDGLVYLTYSEPQAAGGSGLTLARARLARTGDAARLDGLAVIWRDPAGGRGGQFGAIVAFSPDGKFLYLSSGERQRFTPAQDPSQPLGKILRLTPDGKPAPGNPAAGKLGAATVAVTDPPRSTGAAAGAAARTFAWPGPNLTPAETWSQGHRNPYGLAFTPDGRLWETEMGPKGGDELNLILPGRDYGWPAVSNGDNYDGSGIPDHATQPRFEPPKLWWSPSISPSSLLVYTGSLFPRWKGSGFIGALSGEALIRVTFDGDRAHKAEQFDMDTRIRFVAQGPDGAIWLLEDGASGRLLRLAPKG
ncbi:MAG: PQQ-dependent sugar dehydrogenase [Allosphingosinicella sp.]